MSATTRSLFAALAVGLAGLPAFAADEAPVLRERAEQLAASDRCDEALPRARRARELDARDARAALVEGRCQLRLGQYRDAIAPLEAARELDPSLPGVSTDLAQCHYHLEEIDAASAELDRAERENPNDARTELYRGLVLSHQARQREAAAAFDRASGLDPALTGVAALYAGRSWASVQERDKARAALERAHNADPDSEWGRAAAVELENLNAPNRRHVWARVRGGVEHDSNVTLTNGLLFDPITLTQIPGLRNQHEQEDTVAVFDGEVGAEFLRDEHQSFGAAIGYEGNAHDMVHQLDLQYPWFTAWYDRRLSEDTWLRLQPFGGYSWLETDPFVQYGGGTVSLSHAFSDRIAAQIFTRWNVNDFQFDEPRDPVVAFFSIPLAEEFRRFRNRDGVEQESGIEGTFRVIPGRTTLRAGTAYQHYWAEGRDWDRSGSHTWVSGTQALPWSFYLDVNASFWWQPYLHRSSYDDLAVYVAGQGPKRDDKIWDVEAVLRYPVTSWLEVSARGEYTNSESNVATFDFDRWIAGGYVTLTWNDTWGH